MHNLRLITFNLLLISAAILCFEITATRISSVIFVNNYAFFILSLSILGLGTGGIFAYYRLNPSSIPYTLLLLSFSLILFLLAVTQIPFIENPFFFFLLLFLPFFFTGIFYSLVFRQFAKQSFRIYAADLTGAAAGALLAIPAISLLGPVNSVMLIAVVVLGSALSFFVERLPRTGIIGLYSALVVAFLVMLLNGSTNLLGSVPIGNFPEKDFHHVYSDPAVRSDIIDSRWSIFGRSDLVKHSHQDMVRHLFVDGAAGSQMYRFNGNPGNPDMTLQNLLLGFSSTIPLLFLEEDERNNMLVIGPGGGKEVLSGLISGIGEITGVEINADFVNLVKEQQEFNGGIYTDFPNVHILVREGRQYVRQRNNQYDLITMVLPSTQQVQNIENYALSENYLLTEEALQDYLEILNPEGRLIFTVYNEWELKRLILTAMNAFESTGIDADRLPYHIKVIEDQFAPTVVIKKQAYTPDEIANRLDQLEQLPEGFPTVSYMPYQWDRLPDTGINRFLNGIRSGNTPLEQLIDRQPYDIAPVSDDSPYFYKIEKGLPYNFSWLLGIVILFNLLVIVIPYLLIRPAAAKKNTAPVTRTAVRKPLILFTCLGLGFMIVEVSLFQKLVLYLGTPTVSLSVLLSSLLVGMGVGSFFGNSLFPGQHHFRLKVIITMIIILGSVVITLYPWILNHMLVFDMVYRALVTFILLLPFGFLLGIPFPTCIRLVKDARMEQIIPWMYGINGTMSVLGSVLAVVLSMFSGFTPAYFVGLGFYAVMLIFLVLTRSSEVRFTTDQSVASA